MLIVICQKSKVFSEVLSPHEKSTAFNLSFAEDSSQDECECMRRNSNLGDLENFNKCCQEFKRNGTKNGNKQGRHRRDEIRRMIMTSSKDTPYETQLDQILEDVPIERRQQPKIPPNPAGKAPPKLPGGQTTPKLPAGQTTPKLPAGQTTPKLLSGKSPPNLPGGGGKLPGVGTGTIGNIKNLNQQEIDNLSKRSQEFQDCLGIENMKQGGIGYYFTDPKDFTAPIMPLPYIGQILAITFFHKFLNE